MSTVSHPSSLHLFADMLARVGAACRVLMDEGVLPKNADLSRVVVELPRDPSHGDMATNAAMVLAKDAKAKPRDLAEALAIKLRADDLVARVDVAGPGFINLVLKPAAWANALRAVLRDADAYGRVTIGAGEKVNVEYVSANPTGPMHVGHCRGAVFGDALASLLAFAGYDVTRGAIYGDKNIKVTAAENTHYPDHGHDGAQHHLSLSYRFETPDRVVVFSGDTAASDEVIALAKGADVLVHEVIHEEHTRALFTKKFAEQGRSPEEAQRVLKAVLAIHTSVEQVGKIAAAAGVKTVVLNHFVPGFDPTMTDDMWADGVRKNFPGKVIVGRDLMEVD